MPTVARSSTKQEIIGALIKTNGVLATSTYLPTNESTMVSMLVEVKLIKTEEKMNKVMEAMETLQKENVELKEKVSVTDMDANRMYGSNELKDLAEKYVEMEKRMGRSSLVQNLLN